MTTDQALRVIAAAHAEAANHNTGGLCEMNNPAWIALQAHVDQLCAQWAAETVQLLDRELVFA